MSKRKIIYSISFLLLTFIVFSCKKSNVLSKEKMTKVLYDIYIIDAIPQVSQQDFKSVAAKEALLEDILDKHGITRAQLDSSLVWYSDNIQDYNKINDSVVSLLRKNMDIEAKRMRRNMGYYKSINQGILPGYYYLMDIVPVLTFETDSIRLTNFSDFGIKFRTLWVNKDVDLDFSIAFQYPDTTIYNSFKLDKDSVFIVTKPEYGKHLKRISGYFYMDNDNPGHKVFLYDIEVKDSLNNKFAPHFETKIEKDTVNLDEIVD